MDHENVIEEKIATSDIVDTTHEDFNLSRDEQETLLYDFDFPDYNLDIDSHTLSGEDELEWIGDTLLYLVCERQLDQEEIPRHQTQIAWRSISLQNDTEDINESETYTDEIFIIPPPSEVIYDSHDEAEAAIHAWAWSTSATCRVLELGTWQL